MRLLVTLAVLPDCDPHVLIFEQGKLSSPLRCLTLYEARRLNNILYEAIEQGEQVLAQNRDEENQS